MTGVTFRMTQPIFYALSCVFSLPTSKYGQVAVLGCDDDTWYLIVDDVSCGRTETQMYVANSWSRPRFEDVSGRSAAAILRSHNTTDFAVVDASQRGEQFEFFSRVLSSLQDTHSAVEVDQALAQSPFAKFRIDYVKGAPRDGSNWESWYQAWMGVLLS